MAGSDMGFRAVCLCCKNDMMEFVTTFGFPSWASADHPCPLCFCTQENMGEIAGLSLRALPWELKLWQDYVNACVACEIWIDITDTRTLREIRVALEYDKSPNGARGRALTKSFPHLVPSLRLGDRLEPFSGFMDVALFEKMEAPCRILFWRRSQETSVRRHNPLFNEETGVMPHKVFYPDWLHALALGVYKYFIVLLHHMLVAVNAYQATGTTRPAILQESAARFKDRLGQWYASEKASGKRWAEVPNLKWEHLGQNEKGKLAVYGEETCGLLHFTPTLLALYGHALDPRDRLRLERMGTALIGIHSIIEDHKKMGKMDIGPSQAEKGIMRRDSGVAKE